MPSKKSRADAGDGAAQVEAYLANVPEPHRSCLDAIRRAIRASAPKAATECLSYGIPAFRYKGALVAYAAFKKHCSFFPMSAVLLDRFADEVAGLRTSKGTLQFPADKAPEPELIRKLVKERVAENEAKNAETESFV